jgi:nucleotidyltransferase substrate binding protein (TIGR01987 family)
MKNEKRWKQRFENFEKAYSQFTNALIKDTKKDVLLRAGLIQTFEFTFELAWKTLKDKLEYDEISADTPRDVIKEAFQAKYITKADIWLDALKKRNEMSHMYDELLTQQTEQLIRNSYAIILEEVYNYFKKSL